MRTVETADIEAALDTETLLEVLREHPVSLAILFGSYASAGTHPASDVDVAVEFDGYRPDEPEYNDAFLGLGADLSAALGSDDVDLVDLHAASSSLAEAIFDDGVLLLGSRSRAKELRRQTTTHDDARSPRERFDVALARIDEHLEEGDAGAGRSGGAESQG